MKERLRQFNGDKGMKADLGEYLVAHFERKILQTAYEGGDVRVYAAAVNELTKAFEQLAIDYAVPTRTSEPTNEAR